MAAPKALVGVVGVTFTAATFLLLVFFFGVPYLKSKWQHGMHSNVHDSGSSGAALDPQSLVNHSDHFFDVFPLDMTKEMHQRVLCIRRMLRKEIRDFDELRSPVPVHQASQLGTCHLVRKDALDSGAEDVDKDVPVLVGDIFTDGMGSSYDGVWTLVHSRVVLSFCSIHATCLCGGGVVVDVFIVCLGSSLSSSSL